MKTKEKRHAERSDIPEVGFLKIGEVLNFVPVSRSTWYQGIMDGIYPAPIKLGKRSSAWRCADIRALIEKLGGAS